MDAGESYAQCFSSSYGKFHESFNQYIGQNPKDNQGFLDYPTGQILGNPVLHSNYAALVLQSKSNSSTATEQATRLIPMMSTLTQNRKEKFLTLLWRTTE
jgi:hypothetical protein